MFRNKFSRTLICVLALFALATALYAATYSYTVTLDEQGHKRLLKLVEWENAKRAAMKPPKVALSEEEFMQGFFDNAFKGKWRQARRRKRRKMSEAELDASVGVQ